MARTQIFGDQVEDHSITSADLLTTDTYTLGALVLGNTSGTTLSVNTTDLTVDSTNHIVSMGGSASISTFAVIGGSAVTNAILTLTSTTKAFVPPRMTTTQMNAIGTPTEGMLIWNTSTHSIQVYNGTVWQNPPANETDPLSIHLDGSTTPTANISFGGHQITSVLVELRSSNPGSPAEGQIWYRTDLHQYFGYNGTNVVVLG